MSDEPSGGEPETPREPLPPPPPPRPTVSSEAGPEPAEARSSVAAPPKPSAPRPVVVPGGRIANPAAVASIVVGVVALIAGILPLTAPFGAALGVGALSLSLIGLYKASRGGARGKGAAITGFVIGLAGLSAACLWFAIAITTLWRVEPAPDLARAARAELDRTGPTTAIDTLQIGDCFQDPLGGAEVDAVPIAACSQPHDNEVYAILIVQEGPNAPYPGPLQMRATADGECQADPFEAYIGQHYLLTDLEAVAYYPSQARWAAGDREILCVVSDPVGQVSGSLRGTGQPVIQPRPIRPVPRPSVTPLPLPPPAPG